MCSGKNTNEEELENLLEDEEEEEVVDSGDRDIYEDPRINKKVLVCKREPLIFDDN